MLNPKLIVDLAKITSNAASVVRLAAQFGIEITSVTKSVCAAPEVAGAVLAGGVNHLADSRLANLYRLQRAGINAHMTLLRSPMMTEARDVIDVADRVLISDTPVLEALSRAAIDARKTLEVVLMVDLGDLREGFWPTREAWHADMPDLPHDYVDTLDQVIPLFRKLPGLRLCGVGANLRCYGAIIPTVEKMNTLIEAAHRAEQIAGHPLMVISGGNSANVGLLVNGSMPRGITELRIGEAILLGTEAVNKRPVPGCVQDAFTFVAEVIEVRRKPSVPIGKMGIDAFGETPIFVDRGVRYRAIVAAGRQDSDWEDMKPREPGLEVIGSSSDHLVLDAEDRAMSVRTGDEIHFDIGYSCLLRAATSEYVRKVYL